MTDRSGLRLKAPSKASSVETRPARTKQMHAGLRVMTFHDLTALDRWLERQTADAPPIWLKLRKKVPGRKFLTRQEAIDAALCHGWIDGHVLSHDARSYIVRFTPRRARSLWSQINRERAIVLLREGRVQAKGVAQIDAARADGRWAAAYAPASTVKLPADLQEALDADLEAAMHFQALGKAARYAVLHALETVKKRETRERRIKTFIANSNKVKKTD